MNIFKFDFKRSLKSTIIWSIICSGIIIMFMSLFPSMRDMGMQELVSGKLDAIPPALLEALNIEGAMDFSNINDYMGYALQYICMVTGIFGALLGVSALSSEESNGTIEFLYSKPISRVKLVTSKIAVSLANLYLFIMITGIATMGVSIAVKPEDVDTMKLLMDIKTVFIGMFLVGLVFMAIGYLISMLIKAKKNPTPIALGLFFTSYIIGIFAKLKDSVEFLLYASPFEYFVPAKLLKDGFEVKYIVISIVLIVVSIIATYIIYNKKDLES